MIELKNCPFCNSSATFWEKSKKDQNGDIDVESTCWWISCDNWKCGCQTPVLYVNDAECIWNTRPQKKCKPKSNLSKEEKRDMGYE